MTDHTAVRKAFNSAFDSLGEPDVPPVGAFGERGGEDDLVMAVVERDGVLYVDEGRADLWAPQARAAESQVVWERQLTRLDRNEVTGWLARLDEKLTPTRGIRALEDGAWVDDSSVPAGGHLLLMVHGTFSNSGNLLDGIQRNPDGAKFLEWVGSQYDKVLAFDHPTLGLSPLLNALALARALGDTEASIDVVTHSRGGLVTRWWLESFDDGTPQSRRIVFVGSPLAGTGLAAPPRIRATLSLLSNLSTALSSAAGMLPLTAVVAGIFKVVASVTKLAAKTPAIDAAVAMIPGLAAQSRVGNNQELIQQRALVPPWEERYFAVQSNFESERPGWKFWKHFRPSALVDSGADIVFDGTNDLVVDTGSMRELSDTVRLPDEQVLDFGTSDVVLHTNYFEQPETLSFIREKLALD